jgi:hypothetical protein
MLKQMPRKSYAIEFLADLDRTITRARISRYIAAAGTDLNMELELYELNIEVSEAMFGFLHGLEIAVRNSLHFVLSADIGTQDWYRHNLALPFPAFPKLVFTGPMQQMIQKARRSVGSNAPVGKLIAELTFGFWPFVLSGHFHNLWSASAHKAFPTLASLGRTFTRDLRRSSVFATVSLIMSPSSAARVYCVPVTRPGR